MTEQYRRTTQASSCDSVLIRLIKDGALNGCIHSLFARTVNIQCSSSGELYTLACHGVDNAPNTLVAAVHSWSGSGLAVQDPVVADGRMLHLGEQWTVMLDNTMEWQAILPGYPVDAGRMSEHLMAAKDYIAVHGREGGFKKRAASSHFEEEVYRMLQERSHILLGELAGGRMRSALDCAIRLIGLGPGLTPSGDDFLVGLFAAMNLPDCPLRPHTSFCHEIAAASSELTNLVSHTMLKKAANGEVRESVISFLNYLIYGTLDQTLRSLAAVLDIGSSSGTDMALGLIAGLELNQNYAGGNKCQQQS